MPRIDRHDRPGQRHHVMNRGIAKRVCFPDRAAKRRFMALLACAVRRGELIVEAFCILDTHFHLMVRSTDVDLSYALMRIQNTYVRYFNRRFRRDGPLFRGRFRSRPVNSLWYAFTLVRYIDANPVLAGICSDGSRYPYGSASIYARRGAKPRWVDRRDVERWVAGSSKPRPLVPGEYAVWSRACRDSAARAIVEARLSHGDHDSDDIDLLVGRPSAQVADWMRRKAKLADGLEPWHPVAGVPEIDDSIEEVRREHGELVVRPSRTRVDGWPVLHAGLLHGAAGLRVMDVARHLGVASGTASRRVTVHLGLAASDRDYASLAGQVLRAALDRTYATEGGPRVERGSERW